MSILISTHSMKYFTGWTTMSGIQIIHIRFLLSHDILLVISFLTSSLYSFHRIGSLMTSYLVICLQVFGCYATKRARDIYPTVGRTNSSLDSCDPTTYHRRYLKAICIITQLRSDVWCWQSIPPVSGSNINSWSKETIFDIYKIGSVHYIISYDITPFIKWFINPWLGNV